MSDSATPGWYPDPERPGASRYWDGQAWAPSAPPAAPQPAVATGYPGPGYPNAGYGSAPPARVKTDGFAIAALVLSIIGGLLLAVIFAFVARGRIKRSNGALTGKGLTTAALVISGLWVLGIAALIAIGASGILEQENADDFQGEEREVAAVVDRFEDDSRETVCAEVVSTDLRAALGGADCPDQLPSGLRAEIDVLTITITGDTATAVVEEGGDTFTLGFIREGGEWRLHSIDG